jgi:methylmalonyl-CoA/ethylmalonyl-CoA epimerase
MIKGIGHVGIAVKNIEEVIGSVAKALALPVPPIRDIPDKKVKVAVLEVGGTGLEFIESYREDGIFAEFVKERGNAFHHICFLTDQIEAEIEVLKGRGVEMADQKPRMGTRGKRIAFNDPKALHGITFELSDP